MRSILYILSIMFFSSFVAVCQQHPVTNQYLINKYALSPTYAGLHAPSAFLTYRNERVNFPGSALLNNLNINAPLNNKMAFGGSLMHDQIDIFKQLYASLSYTYRVKINEKQGLHFGLWGGLYENTFDFSNKNLSKIVPDPLVADKMNQRGTAISSGAGLLYSISKFNIGIDIPNIVESELNYKTSNTESPFRLRRLYQVHISNIFTINNNLTVEPIGISRYYLNTPLAWEAAILLCYQNNYWLSSSFKSSMDIGFGLGGKINDVLVLSYHYEFSNKGIGQHSAGTHELGIGYFFKPRPVKKHLPSAYENSLIHKIDSLENYTQTLEGNIEQLKETQIITEKEYQAKVDELEKEITSLNMNIESLLNEMATLKQNDSDSATIEEITNPNVEKAFYVILDSYKKLDKAARGSEIWKTRGYKAKVIHKPKSQWYHVYSHKYDNITEAVSKMKELRSSGRSGTWILVYKNTD